MTIHLLAKSYSKDKSAAPPRYARLEEHTEDVVAAGRVLITVAGAAALRSLSLSPDLLSRFSEILRLNAWIQDLGKANSHFLEMLADWTRPQMLRHEAVSALLMRLPECRNWLGRFGNDATLALWAAAGHHRKFFAGTSCMTATTSMTIYVDHPQFKSLLEAMSRDLALEAPPTWAESLTVSSVTRQRSDATASKMLSDMKLEFSRAAALPKRDVKLLALVKGFGIAADVAASAFGRTCESSTEVGERVESLLSKGRLRSSDVRRLLWHWSGADNHSIDDSCHPPSLIARPFQSKVAESQELLTLARAGCGSGKSLAAYLWAEQWAERYEREGRTDFRLIFTLPTTGTATEHFKDYALEAGFDVELSHSRAGVDLETIAAASASEESEQPNQENDALSSAVGTQQKKIEALQMWATPLTVATTDTVLGLMSNALRPLCSLPAIVSSAIVFDEIHAYDETLFGHLLVFLKNFTDIPVLLMTASLQSNRLEAIRRVRSDLKEYTGPADAEELPRYEIKRSHTDDAMIEVEECLHRNEKVLWVSNTVDRANDVYRRCVSRFADSYIQVYHSRFRYRDRSIRHRSVIKRFNDKTEAALLCSTQVAEMSLDLSADLLISDIAPIPSLIQRMGRLNRRWMPGQEGTAKPALMLPLTNSKPYDEEEIQTASLWIDSLITQRAVSQRRLADQYQHFEKHQKFDIVAAEDDAVFFSGIWQTEVRKTRSDGYTINVVLEKDFKLWAERNGSRTPDTKWLREHEVAVVYRDVVKKWKTVAYLPIAPSDAISYDWTEETHKGVGAEWRKN